MKSTLIMKFGGAAVETPAHFSKIADIIVAKAKEYRQVAVVVSAMGDMTDQLIALAKEVNSDPPRREYDMLITVGERISISLLAMALAAKKKKAISFTGSQSGIITSGTHSDARIIEVRPHRLLPHLKQGTIVIVAGFQGVSQKGEITTLGRGGSDTTAVALGLALKADKVEFFKDVAGIFEEDPKKKPGAKLLSSLSYEEALKIVKNGGGQVLHERCIALAGRNGLPLHVLSFHDVATHVGSNHQLGTVISEERRSCQQDAVYEEVPAE